MSLKIANVVGARPNFMKIAPIHRRMQESNVFDPILIHTGQHYDERMSKSFFVDLNMPEPDIYLGVGSGTHAEQTAAVLVKMEKALLELKPDYVLVVGDVNSTISASLAAAKLNIPVVHVEAGLRSFDREMPEEINRVLTDSIAEHLFVTEHSGLVNLAREGVAAEKVHFVGNVMIDSLVEHLEKAANIDFMGDYPLQGGEFVLMTMHRPSNVDHPQTLEKLLFALDEIQKQLPILFPIHPRTQKRLNEFGLQRKMQDMKNMILIEPLGYMQFLHVMQQARLLLTDSGGIQEETTFLKIPCITMRDNTERPITIELGTNQLVGNDPFQILAAVNYALNYRYEDQPAPPLWDGLASKRIVDIMAKQ